LHELLNDDHLAIENLINQNKKEFREIEAHYQDHA
jgi:hypothetical protein